MQGPWRPYVVPAAVAVAGIVLSLLVYRWVDRAEEQRVASELERRTANITRVLSSGIDSYANLVQSYANQTALFNRSIRNADPAELLAVRDAWERMKPSIRQTILDAQASFPGIRMYGWATPITQETRAEFEAAARLLVTPGYHLRELGPDQTPVVAGDRDEYVPVFYAEPFEQATPLIGLDLLATGKVREPLLAALHRNRVTASEPIRLIREVTGQLGIVLISPVFQDGAEPANEESRADSVATYLFAIVLVDDMLNSALAGLDEPGIDFFVFPGVEDVSPRSLTAVPVYASNGDPASIDRYRADESLSRFAQDGVLDVAGKSWDMYFVPTRGFVAMYSSWMPETVLTFSCLFTLIVSAYLAFFIGRAERVSRLVASRTQDLELANKALQAEINMRREAESQKRGLESQLYQAQRMDSIGNLAGGIAHDFNNILLAVLGYIDLSRGNEDLPPKVARYLDSAKSAGDRAVSLTKQLLAFGRRQALEVAPHDLNEVVAGFETIFERIVPENIRFTCRKSEGPCVVLADSGQLEQVVMNLVVNACEAMPDGGELTISMDVVALSEADLGGRPSLAPGAYVRMTVADTGDGISVEDIDRIFEPFYSTKQYRQGTGLGLAVVYGIVEQHGGFVEAHSAPGKGAVFTVYLPRTEETAVRPVPVTQAPAAGGTETILVVEDEFEVRQLAQMVLEQAGYRVLVAENGREALELFERHREEVALVFADVVMPEMGGRELSAAIHAIDSGIPVILTSGYLGGADRQYFIESDVPFVAKPYSPVVLRTEIRRALDRRPASARRFMRR